MKDRVNRLIDVAKFYEISLTFKAPTSENGQTHSNNLSAFAGVLTILWGGRLKG